MKPLHDPYSYGAVRLRPLAEDDLHATLEWRNRDGVRQQFKTPGLLTWEQHHRWFASYAGKPDDIVFIVESLETGERVGQVAIYAIDDVARRAEVGRFIAAPGFQGKGYMRQAISALLRLARQRLGLDTVYLDVLETNDRALRLYAALEFVRTGVAHGLVVMERDIREAA